MDIRVNKEFVKVQHGTLGVVLSDYYETARVETEQTVEHATGLDGISTTGLDPLPDPGEPVEEIMYAYNGAVVLCRQAHTRTAFPPEETPALFTFVRSGTDLDWIPNEKVEVGETRWYEGTEYEVDIAHLTLDGREPTVYTAGWSEVQETGDAWVPPEGAHDAYQTGDIVTHDNETWISTIDDNVWEPGVTGWDVYTP
jgi:hypothetical protein